MGYVGQAPGKVVLSSGDITDGIIINADIASDAAIVISKTALSAGTGITLSTNTLNIDASQTQITGVGTITTGTWTATDVAVAHGGTGASTATAGFDALAPMTAAGDIIYGGASGTGTRLAKGSDTQVLTLASGAPSWATPAATYTNAEAITAVEGESTLVLQSGATIGGSAAATVSNKLSAFAATTSSELAGVISNETGSGALVFATSPTLVTPALGTPASGVATNLTGTAASLTAGNVTTNANLTGHVTSTGNAAVLGSFTKAQLSTAVSDGTPLYSGDITIYTDAEAIAAVEGEATLTLAGDVEIADSKFIEFASAAGTPTTDNKAQGIVIEFLAAEAITQFDAVYVSTTTGRVGRADANVASMAKMPVIGIAIEAQGSAGSSVRVLTHGVYRDDGGFGGNMTVGVPLYAPEAPGTLTTTAPSDDGDYVQKVGVAVGVRSVFINPSLDVIEHA